jgi:hypothetical protein
MRRLTIFAALAALIAGTSSAQAVSFTFQTIDNPADPTSNQLLGINNSGVIAGYFGSGAPGHPNKGYSVAARTRLSCLRICPVRLRARQRGSTTPA